MLLIDNICVRLRVFWKITNIPQEITQYSSLYYATPRCWLKHYFKNDNKKKYNLWISNINIWKLIFISWILWPSLSFEHWQTSILSIAKRQSYTLTNVNPKHCQKAILHIDKRQSWALPKGNTTHWRMAILHWQTSILNIAKRQSYTLTIVNPEVT